MRKKNNRGFAGAPLIVIPEARFCTTTLGQRIRLLPMVVRNHLTGRSVLSHCAMQNGTLYASDRACISGKFRFTSRFREVHSIRHSIWVITKLSKYPGIREAIRMLRSDKGGE